MKVPCGQCKCLVCGQGDCYLSECASAPPDAPNNITFPCFHDDCEHFVLRNPDDDNDERWGE